MSAYEGFQLAVIAVMLAVFALSRGADRYPHLEWLRGFRQLFPRLPEEQRHKAARRGNIYAGIQLILLGIAIPPAYMVLEMMMFFSETTTTEMLLVGASALMCITLGVTAIWRNRR